MIVFCKTTVQEKQGLNYVTQPPAATGAGCSGLISYCSSIGTKFSI
jgi:hypothetical protein